MDSPIPRPPSNALLDIAGLSVHFEQRSAIEEITAQIGAGEIVSLVGPNGAGKSTVLRVLAGILPPSHGQVTLRGRAVSRPSRAVVYVPQRAGVDWSFPVSVLDITLMGRMGRRSRWLPLPGADRRDALEALERVGMRDLTDVQIGQLSGGQQQRVFLARALLQGGDVLLLDEPLAGVDVPTQELLLELFAAFRTQGKTILFATHDLAQASRSSDRIMLINRQLIAFGSPAEVLTAAHLRAAFGGQAIVLPPSDSLPRATLLTGAVT